MHTYVQWKLLDKLQGTYKISSCYQMFLSGLAYYMYTTTAKQMILGNYVVCLKQKFALSVCLNEVLLGRESAEIFKSIISTQ